MKVNRVQIALAAMQVGTTVLSDLIAAKADGHVDAGEASDILVGAVTTGVQAVGAGELVIYNPQVDSAAHSVAARLVDAFTTAAEGIEAKLKDDATLTLGEAVEVVGKSLHVALSD